MWLKEKHSSDKLIIKNEGTLNYEYFPFMRHLPQMYMWHLDDLKLKVGSTWDTKQSIMHAKRISLK